MLEVLSPKVLFLRYAIGCAETSLSEKRITTSEYGDLIQCVKNGVEPTLELLKRAFPKEIECIGFPFSTTNVAHFWRVAQMNDRESPVFIGQINKPMDDGGGWLVHLIAEEELREKVFLNMADLDLRIGDKVYCYGGVIAETVPRASPLPQREPRKKLQFYSAFTY